MAILKRKKPHGFIKRTQESVWPSMGWGRAFHYYRHRIFRDGSSTYRITAGIALGAAISFSPFIGTHFLQVAAIAPLMRASILAGFAGTVFGNPWTFPFLFWIGYKVGVFVCGLFGMGDFLALPGFMDMEYFTEQPFAFLSFLFAHPLKLLLPMAVGGYICALLFWPLAYLLLYYPVRYAQVSYKKERRKRRKKQ